MRTTVTIDDDLYRQVKERAARTGRSVSAVIEDAVRRALFERGRGADRPAPPLPTFATYAPRPPQKAIRRGSAGRPGHRSRPGQAGRCMALTATFHTSRRVR